MNPTPFAPDEKLLFPRVMAARQNAQALELYRRQQQEMFDLRRRQLQASRLLRWQGLALTLLTILLSAALLAGWW